MTSKWPYLLVSLMLLCLPMSEAFPLQLGTNIVPGGSNTTIPKERKDVAESEAFLIGGANCSEITENAKLEELIFHGEFRHNHVTSFPHNQLSSRRLYNFFQERRNRNLLLKGGGNPTKEITATPEIFQQWTSQSRAVSTTPPVSSDDHHSVVAICSTVPIIPGLSIKAISYTGCRLLTHPDTLLPMYEFTLIQDRYQAEGSKPLLWLYRKITGEKPNYSSGSSPFLAPTSNTGSRSTHGVCRVMLEPLRTTEAKQVLCLSYYSMVKVSCNLPQRLLKALPLSKEAIESKISSSMVKQLEAEVTQSVDKFHSALASWYST